MRSAALGLAFLCASVPAAHAAGEYDGRWAVTRSCPAARDGAKGYTWRFDVTVVNGVMHGQYGPPGSNASMTIDGRIGPDGAAMLLQAITTGDSDYNVGRVVPGRLFNITVNAQFTGDRGAGTQTEVRPCSIVFARR